LASIRFSDIKKGRQDGDGCRVEQDFVEAEEGCTDGHAPVALARPRLRRSWCFQVSPANVRGVNWVILYFGLFWGFLIRVGISEEWALLGVVFL